MNYINKYFLDVMKKHYVDFSGRATRSQFWFFVLFQFITLIAIGLIAGIAGDNVIGKLFGLLYMITALAFILPYLGLTWRRLHDTDRSGLWFFIGFIPAVGGIILLILLCLPSTPGQNRFGAHHNG